MCSPFISEVCASEEIRDLRWCHLPVVYVRRHPDGRLEVENGRRCDGKTGGFKAFCGLLGSFGCFWMKSFRKREPLTSVVARSRRDLLFGDMNISMFNVTDLSQTNQPTNCPFSSAQEGLSCLTAWPQNRRRCWGFHSLTSAAGNQLTEVGFLSSLFFGNLGADGLVGFVGWEVLEQHLFS